MTEFILEAMKQRAVLREKILGGVSGELYI